MALNANALTTTASLELDDAANTEVKEKYINLASQIIETGTNRLLVKQTITETVQSKGNDAIICSQYPIVSLSTVTIYGAEIDTTELIIDKTSGIIRNQYSVFTGNATITYDAGFVVSGVGKNIPADLEQACIQLAKYLYYNEPNFNLSRENTAGIYPEFVTQTIAAYRNGVPK